MDDNVYKIKISEEKYEGSGRPKLGKINEEIADKTNSSMPPINNSSMPPVIMEFYGKENGEFNYSLRSGTAQTIKDIYAETVSED
jgi:hypothetical protein